MSRILTNYYLSKMFQSNVNSLNTIGVIVVIFFDFRTPSSKFKMSLYHLYYVFRKYCDLL